ncbi:hypothetical protein [Bradyrhizobium elkanii]|uniref:Uncharacterized protein n=1 Tax=Bradyrhizobium diazoefficiens TaxID=1355477 RepID=A0A810CS00_9BRAD|nr:hypothetical protein [Bradyrhizobium elkanii]BCE22095.1 hypothetical protein XF1B_47760 [Bradyrhizobium diazoefficiens]WLB84960.1 hypothetical protein QIH83_21385 [Bradyrhizobium elkanii]BCE48360.1 hypothetical protein XF4B_47090 [Bradyrhizobium diazoefficiens]BCE91876.1 hypothetical protein XF10B_46740 [Bradyrhizobium diazoefficiens]BCF26804.1 hypothetical protein XF14B_47560 [Bradyrhizobium diazoefficiens]
MKQYSVFGTVTASKFMGRFWANSKEEAIAMAEKSENNFVSLCHQCNDQCEDPEIHEMTAEEVT